MGIDFGPNPLPITVRPIHVPLAPSCGITQDNKPIVYIKMEEKKAILDNIGPTSNLMHVALHFKTQPMLLATL
jgi:hypothetical protein